MAAARLAPTTRQTIAMGTNALVSPLMTINAMAAMMLNPINTEKTNAGTVKNNHVWFPRSASTPMMIMPGRTRDKSMSWTGFTISPATSRLGGGCPEMVAGANSLSHSRAKSAPVPIRTHAANARAAP